MSWEGDAAMVVGLVTRSAPIPSKLKIESTATNLVNFVLNTHPSLLDRANFQNPAYLRSFSIPVSHVIMGRGMLAREKMIRMPLRKGLGAEFSVLDDERSHHVGRLDATAAPGRQVQYPPAHNEHRVKSWRKVFGQSTSWSCGTPTG
jgi:hypothetical protein